MPANVTASSNITIQPSRQTNSSNKSTIIRRDGAGDASGFAPRTNVSIANSVSDMAGVLAKISYDQVETESVLPKQIQQMIDNIMQSSFSVDSSIGEGVGSALASSRFSTEQMSVLSRMVNQMANLANQGQLTGVSDEVLTILQNVRNLASDVGVTEPAMLNKLAFQLLTDNETDSQATQQVMQLLAQLNIAGSVTMNQNTGESEGLNFLKQLVDAFFPPKSVISQQSTASAQNTQTGNAQTNSQMNTHANQQNMAQAFNHGQAQGETSNQGQTAMGQNNPSSNGMANGQTGANNSSVSSGTAQNQNQFSTNGQAQGQMTNGQNNMSSNNMLNGQSSANNGAENNGTAQNQSQNQLTGQASNQNNVQGQSNAQANAQTNTQGSQQNSAQNLNQGQSQGSASNNGQMMAGQNNSASETMANNQPNTNNGSAANGTAQGQANAQNSQSQMGTNNAQSNSGQLQSPNAQVGANQNANNQNSTSSQTQADTSANQANNSATANNNANNQQGSSQQNGFTGNQGNTANNTSNLNTNASGNTNTNANTNTNTNTNTNIGNNTRGSDAGSSVNQNNLGSQLVKQGGQSASQMSNQGYGKSISQQVAELENNPLFRNIFSKHSSSTSTSNQLQQQAAAQSQNNLPTANMQNNQQAMNAMKDLANLLLKDANMSQKDTQLLQNFVNANRDTLSEQDAKQLNQLLRMVQTNTPAALQQMANQQGMDGLSRLWAFMQLCDLASLKNLKSRELKNASKQLSKFTAATRSSMESDGSYRADGQKSISFMMPIYIGENEKSYPAYVHVYQGDSKENNGDQENRKETWLRLCVLTDNIGAVEMTCCVYDDNSLNMRVLFSDERVIKDFNEYVPELKDYFKGSALTLNDLKVGTVK